MFVLLLQLLTTPAMFGLIWFVQVVHYPLFLQVGEAGFRDYAALHATRTTWVVGPLMLVELGSACLLLFRSFRPACIGAAGAWAGAALIAVIWLSTALLQVPLHDRLQKEYSAANARRLVATNWVRTIGWSLRTALVLAWAWQCIAHT